MSKNTKLTITNIHNEQDKQFLINSINNYNQSIAPTTFFPHLEELNLVLKDDQGTIYGGALGILYRYALFIHILWVDESKRGKGYGTLLLSKMEGIAKERGCTLIHLDTWEHQAPQFYIKQGFELFGTLDGFAEGFKRHFLRKLICVDMNN